MSTSPDKLAARSAAAILGPNPFVSFSARDVVREAMRAARLAAAQPRLTAKAVLGFGSELRKIVQGASTLAPAPRDKRFNDPSWQSDARYRAWLQAYLAAGEALRQWIAAQDLKTHSRARLEFMSSLALDALAPSNFPWQPEAIKRFRESGGHSALDGIKQLVHNIRENQGLPEQVDKSGFTVGGNLACTEGAVVFRNEVFELIRYRPRTAEVRAVPMLFIPPQINKFYIFDLSPEKSVVKGLLEAGFEVFMISWRNPETQHADWGLAEYAAAIDMGIGAVCNITNSQRISLSGACAGGITIAGYVAARAASGDTRVSSVTLMVSVLDTQATSDTPMGLFATPRTIEAARRKSAKKGVLDGKTMAAAFSWLRPNDLIWNYWVNNVLLGNKPPAFDLLFWNCDSTRLPARLHGEFMDILLQNSLVHPGRLRLHGVPVDLSRVKADAYVLGGTTDHITPWKGCHRSTLLFGGQSSFVLSNAGHMQSILNPPGNKKSEFWTDGEVGVDADSWRAGAKHHSGSWWPHWHTWLHKRSGAMRPAEAVLASADYPELAAAPGTYVFG